jgi:PKD repeat protein
MPNVSSYPVFEPDQVLTDTHLNNLFAYLDQQDHLTRNKLLGIGIVCGLNITADDNQITITKGVGITSLGFLLQFEGGTFTDFRPYTVPDFPDTIEPAVHASYATWNAQLLIPSEKKAKGDKKLKDNAALQKSHAVVLFLEPQLTDLKNCTTEDCNDKGKRVDLTVRPLLVPKAVLQQYKYFNLQQQKFVFPQVHLKRWNVPVQNMQHPANVVQAFDNVLNAKLLNELSTAYTFVFDLFAPILASNGDDKPANVYTYLSNLVQGVRSAYPVFYQYLYDYVDDLIKAYLDFREVVFDVLSECCPDEHLFPLHLALGEAGLSTDAGFSAYRNEFIYSPLFSEQKQRLAKARMYYRRMLLLLKTFELASLLKNEKGQANASSRLAQTAIRITPSCLGDFPLGKRCIPYYYNPGELFQTWDAEKTRRGKATTNYGYYASLYSNDAAALQPLLYDTEPYNFFRIEGHAGMEVNKALQNIVAQKQSFNLPFDVVALNMYPGQLTDEREKLKCYFNDLESQYNVLIAEMLCKLHGLYCAAGKWPFNKKIFDTVFRPAGSGGNTTAFKEAGAYFSATKEASGPAGATVTDAGGVDLNEGITDKILAGKTYEESLQLMRTAAISFVDQTRRVNPYRKGTYLRQFCKPDPKAETVASYYLNWLKANEGKRWPKPAATVANTNPVQWMIVYYFHLFYLIDVVEELLQRILPFDLGEINFGKFKKSYDEVMEEVEAFADYFDNLLHGLDILNDQKDIEQQKPFNLIQEELEEWILEKAVTKVVADSRGLLMMCIDDQLQQLLYEYRKRLQYVLNQHIFSNYARLKPGLEHKAGVPKGGTFVLLYFKRPPRTQVVTNRSAAFDNVEAIAVAEEDAIANEERKMSTAYGKKYKPSGKEKLEQQVGSIESFLEKNKNEFEQQEFEQITTLLTRVRTMPASAEALRIPEGVVFADLYIPYMCCSECAPTAFVFQEKTEESPQPDIDIKRTFFCNNEDVKEPITVKPEGGTVTGQGVTKEGDQYFFNPKGLAEDNYVLQYKLESKTDTVNVTVKAVYDPAFTFQQTGTDPASNGVIVAFSASAQAGQHTWDFGDQTAPSNEVNPKHVYAVASGEASFEVTHTVTNGNCTLPPVKQKVNIIRENPIDLSIGKSSLCTNDQPEPLLATPAGGVVSCTENPQAIQQTAAGFSFVPQLSGTGLFTIRYDLQGQSKTIKVTVEQAPSAAFDSKMIKATADSRTIRFTTGTAIATHQWKFGDGQTAAEPNPQLTFKLADHPEGLVKVTHTVSGKVCQATAVSEVSLQVPVEDSKLSICYTTAPIPLEPKLDTDASLVILENGGQQLGEDGRLILSEKLPEGNTNFTVRYIVNSAKGVVEKRITIVVNRLSEEVRLSANQDILRIASNVKAVNWTILVNNGQTQVIKTGTQNPMVLKLGSEAPRAVEIAFIITAEVQDGDCKTRFTKTLPAKKYNEFIKSGGELIL